MLTLIVSLLISILIVLVFKFLNEPHRPPLFGVYQQKNKCYWLKFVVLFVGFTVRQWIWRFKRAYAVDVGRSCDGTIHVHQDDVALEQKFALGDYSQAVDAAYFNGIALDGDAVTFSLAQKQGGVCDAHATIKLNGKTFLSPKLPDTYLEQEKCNKGEFRVGMAGMQGMQINNFIPMRTWNLSYNGEMKSRSEPERTVKVQAELTWSALFAPFNYDYQMSPLRVASDMATEPWSRDNFRTIQKFHQTHYQQMGSLKGTVSIDGKEHVIKMPCFRARTFGKFCEWRNFHRYVFHTLYLENGECLVVGSTSQPLLASHITMGFVCKKSDQSVRAVRDCDFKLYQHGENQILPMNYAFTLKAHRETYTVHVTVDSEELFYIGKQRDAKIYERCVSVDVNGVSGRGFSHWMYNNV